MYPRPSTARASAPIDQSDSSADGDSGAADTKNVHGHDDPMAGLDSNLVRAMLAKFLLASPASSSTVQDRLRWIQTAKEISPVLALNGNNYPAWSAALRQVVLQTTLIKDFFEVERSGFAKKDNQDMMQFDSIKYG